jgi:aarF domain-containing kinase
MRGAALKLGQMISMQDTNLFPPEFEEIFARVRDGANFMPAWQLEGVMRDELGAEWKSKFEEFEMIPFAAASIGQVHRAKVGGKLVAVKVQYPGVAKSIISDLENLKALLIFSQMLPKGLFLENSIRVAQKELAWECDYTREAEYMKKSASLLPTDSGLVVPTVCSELSTGKVLTADYLPGTPVNLLIDASQEVRDSVAKRIVWSSLQEMFNWRCMQTDPNWSNFLYDAAVDRIVLLDYGSARDFDLKFVQDYAQVIQASARQDRDAILEWSTKLGFLTGDETVAMRDAHVEAVLALGLPFTTAGPYDFGKATDEVTTRVRGLIPTMISYRLIPPPEESYSLHRKLSGVFLLCTRLRAKVDCHSLLQQALSQIEKD